MAKNLLKQEHDLATDLLEAIYHIVLELLDILKKMYDKGGKGGKSGMKSPDGFAKLKGR
ncbi:hypothetical protein M8C21_003413, partial [Ambrosia artemisiifolia]